MVNGETQQAPEVKKTLTERVKELVQPFKQPEIKKTVKEVIEESRRKPPVFARTVSTLASVPQALRGTRSSQPLTKFQKNILQRERVLRLIRKTPPMDRPKALRGTNNFLEQRDVIRSDIKPRKMTSGIIPLEQSKAQQAQARFKEKINSAKRQTIGEKTEVSKFSGVAPFRLKAPSRLL